MYDEDGHEYLDFFAGAGSLNYGHNNPVLKRALIDYLERDGVTHGLDMSTTAKRAFLESFQNYVLRPRDLPYKVMFPGPTGTNAVESALKLARKVKGREAIVSFTNAFHGMSLGSLAVTGNAFKRAGAGIPLVHGTPMPFDNYFDGKVEDFLWFERLLEDQGSGLNKPAAVIVETVQGEGGINVASIPWLQRLREVTAACGILLAGLPPLPVVGDVAGVPALNVARRVRECVPDRRRAAVLLDGALDLVARRRGAPGEARREPHRFAGLLWSGADAHGYLLNPAVNPLTSWRRPTT